MSTVPNPMGFVMIGMLYLVIMTMINGGPDVSYQFMASDSAETFEDDIYGFSPPSESELADLEGGADVAEEEDNRGLLRRGVDVVRSFFGRVAEAFVFFPKLVVALAVAAWSFYWSVLMWFWSMATLDVAGAPGWARAVVGTYFLGTALLTAVWLAERVANILGPLIPFTVYLGPPGGQGGEED